MPHSQLDILAMPTGLQLDRLIAENVMGYRWFIDKTGAYYLLDPDEPIRCSSGNNSWNLMPPKDLNSGLIPWPQKSDVACCHVPCFSTRIDLAWRVVDALCQAGLNITIHYDQNNKNNKPWKCIVSQYFKNIYSVFSSNTPAHAICLAALEALTPPTETPQKK